MLDLVHEPQQRFCRQGSGITGSRADNKLSTYLSNTFPSAGQPWRDESSDEDVGTSGRGRVGGTPFYLLTAVPDGERLDLPAQPDTPFLEYPQVTPSVRAALCAIRGL